MNIMVSAYLDNNIGDDLMIKLFARNFPEDKFYLYTDSSVISRSFLEEENIVIRELEEKAGDFDKMDIYLTVGGSIFQIQTIRAYIYRIFGILRLIKLRRKGLKIATLGCNLGPYSKLGKYLTKLELRKNDLVTVRDSASLDTIKAFGKIKNFYLAEDIVYNLKGKLAKAKEGLGISVYRSLTQKENNYHTYEALALIADKYIERTQKKVKLFAFNTENENDLVAAHHIFNLAKNKNKIEIIPYLGEKDSFLDQFKTCETMVAIRFHSAVLSDIYNIPFLPIAYSNKMQNYMKDRGFKGEMIDWEDLSVNLDINSIVEKLARREGLYDGFLAPENSSMLHFEKLRELKRSIKNNL